MPPAMGVPPQAATETVSELAAVELTPPRCVTPLAIPSRLYLTAAALILACLPWLILQAERLWDRPEYQFFPLIVVGAALLALRDFKGLHAWVPGEHRLTCTLLGGCWGLLLLACLCFSPRLGTTAAIALLGVALYAFGGTAAMRRLLPAWAFIWLLVPPLDLIDKLMLGMQRLTARCSSEVLDVAGVWHVLAGNVVEVSGQRLLVEDACSGVHSLFAVLACTLFFVLWLRYHWARALLLFAAALAWVVLANVTRVSAVAYLSTAWSIDIAHGWRHDALGVVLFAVALALTVSTDRLLRFLRPVAEASALPQQETSEAEALSLPVARTPLSSTAVAASFGVLALLELLLFMLPATAGDAAGMVQTLNALDEGALPARLGPWERQGFESNQKNRIYGEFTRSWTFALGPRTALVSIGYPFTGWKNLTLCYEVQGWRIESQLTQSRSDASAEVETLFRRHPDRYAYLCFGMLSEHGISLAPPAERGYWQGQVDRLGENSNKVWRTISGAPVKAGPSFLVQVFVESYTPLTPAEQQQARVLFEQARDGLRKPVQGH